MYKQAIAFMQFSDQNRSAKLESTYTTQIAIFICFAVTSAAIAVDMHAITLSNEADEGVYWQSLRAMSAGYHLYSQIFYSQPPLFLMSIYPFYELLGSTITAARLGIATLSLLGLFGAYLMGKAFGGRGRRYCRRASSYGHADLSRASSCSARRRTIYRSHGSCRRSCFHVVRASYRAARNSILHFILTALVAAVLIKLLAVTAIVPIVLLALARMWQIRNDHNGKHSGIIYAQLGVATIAALFVALVILAPFLHSWNSLMDQVVKFHLAAKKMMVSWKATMFQF